MADEIGRLVHLSAVRPVLGVVLVVHRVDHKDVIALDRDAGVVLPALEMGGPVELVVYDPHLVRVDDTGGTNQPLERKVSDELAAGIEVGGCIEMGANVKRGGDLLASGPVERKSLDPLQRGSVVR